MINENTKYWNNDTIHAYAKKQYHLDYKNSKVQTNYKEYKILYKFTDSTYSKVINDCDDTIKFYNKLLSSKHFSAHNKQIIQKLIKYTNQTKNALSKQSDKAIQTDLLKLNQVNITSNFNNVSTYIKANIHNHILALNNSYINQAKTPELRHINSNFVKDNQLSHLVYDIFTSTKIKPSQCTTMQLTQKYYDIYAYYRNIRLHAYNNILVAIMNHNKTQLLKEIHNYNQNNLTFNFTIDKIVPATITVFTRIFQLIKNIVTHEIENNIPWDEVFDEMRLLPKNAIKLASTSTQKEWKAFSKDMIKKETSKQDAEMTQRFNNDTKSLKNQFAQINK